MTSIILFCSKIVIFFGVDQSIDGQADCSEMKLVDIVYRKGLEIFPGKSIKEWELEGGNDIGDDLIDCPLYTG